MFNSNGNANANGFAVRPVVYLKSEVTINDLKIEKSGEEETWTTSAGWYNEYSLSYGQIKGAGSESSQPR